jgi:DNA-binding LacI/PurR family transcriptional regulator
LARRGLPYLSERVIQNSSPAAAGSWETSYARVLTQIRKGVRAWICNHDDVGYNLMRFLRGQQLQVPKDISLCAFDNLDAQESLPKMTSIDWPFEDIGAAAVRRLLHRGMEPTTASTHLMIRGRLVPGASTAPLAPVT